MATTQIADCIANELRLLGLMGAFQYGKYHISYLALAIFILLMICMGIQHTITIVYLETIDQLTEILYIFGIYIVACCKLSALILNRDKLTAMMDSLTEKLMFPFNWNHLYQNEFAETVRHIRMASRFFLYVVYVAILATVTSQILNKKQIFHCYFPFDTSYAYSVQGYWLANAYEFIYALYLIKCNISMDVMIMALLHCAAVKLKVMRYECEKLCTSIKCIDNIKAVRAVSIFHNDTVKYIGEIESIFSFGLFVQCFLSGLSICIVMLKAILLDVFTETEQLLGVVIVLISYIVQIFFYCHYGNQIQHQSTKLFTSIYLCEWYNLNCNCPNYNGKLDQHHSSAIKRSISVMLERTKRPNIITAGKFIKLTYDSYITIVKTGYQFFTVLRDVLK